MLSKTGLLPAFLLSAAAAIAQQSDAPPDSLMSLAPAEVRALRLPANAPFANSNLNAAELAKQNIGQDLPFLLQYTPSAVVTSDAGTGIGYTGIRIRGTDGTRMNVTLNGIPVNDAESGGTFFVNFPDLASSTSSIQIQRGVGASTNGPGAFGATLSAANLNQHSKQGAEAIIGAGSFNTQRLTLKAGTGLLKGGWQVDVRLSRIKSDGYIDRSASDLRALQMLATWNVRPTTNLKFMVMTGREKTGQAWNGVPQDSLFTNRRLNGLGQKSDGSFYGNQTDNYGQDYYQLFLNHRFSRKWATSVATFLTRGKGYYEEYKIQEPFVGYGLQPYVAPSGLDTLLATDLARQLWLDNYFYGATFALHRDDLYSKTTIGGVLSRYDGGHYGIVQWASIGIPDNYRWYNLKARKTDATAYIKSEVRLGSVQLFGDLQWRHVRHTINGFRNNPLLRHDLIFNFFNPKMGVNYDIVKSPSRHLRVYASVAVAQKEPNRDDFEAVSNALPKAERLTDFEAGGEWRSANAHLSGNFYYMRYSDQLVLSGKVNDVGAYSRINVPNSYRLGVELTASYKALSWLIVGGNATFSQNKILDFTEYVDDYDAGGQQSIRHGTTDLAFSPSTVTTGIFTLTPFPVGHWLRPVSVDWYHKYVGRQFLDNTGNLDRAIESYYLSDMRFQYRFSPKFLEEIAFQIAVNNLFDRQYESNGYTFSFISDQRLTTSNYYFPQAGRNFLAAIHLRF